MILVYEILLKLIALEWKSKMLIFCLHCYNNLTLQFCRKCLFLRIQVEECAFTHCLFIYKVFSCRL